MIPHEAEIKAFMGVDMASGPDRAGEVAVVPRKALSLPSTDMLRAGFRPGSYLVLKLPKKTAGSHADRLYMASLSLVYSVLSMNFNEYAKQGGRNEIKRMMTDAREYTFKHIEKDRPSINDADVIRIGDTIKKIEPLFKDKNTQSLIGFCLGVLETQKETLEECKPDHPRLIVIRTVIDKLNGILKYYTRRTRETYVERFAGESVELMKVFESSLE